MLNEMIKSLDQNLEYVEYQATDNQYIITVHSLRTEVACPYCQTYSSKVHSVYNREIQDLPIQDKQTWLQINTRKMFCINPDCHHKTFAETFDFVARHGKKTKRLVEKILATSAKLGSVSASILLKNSAVTVSKCSICTLVKKNASDCG